VSQTLRLGFAGTPVFAAKILEALLDLDHEVVRVLTQPDRPAGRGQRPQASPVKTLAQSRGLDVRSPGRLDDVSLDDAALDLLIVAAYGLILPRHILDSPRLGCVNVHASLLPRWRGAAPVERAIMAGDDQTGVCLMQMDEGLDTGAVYACERLAISNDDTGASLEARLATAGAALLAKCLPRIESTTPTPQNATGVSYARKITAQDTVVDWSRSASAIARQIRALAERRPVAVHCRGSGRSGEVRIRLLAATATELDPRSLQVGPTEPGAIIEPGTIIEIVQDGLRVACGSGALLIHTLQLNRGQGRPMPAATAANGHPDLLSPGRKLLTVAPDHSA